MSAPKAFIVGRKHRPLGAALDGVLQNHQETADIDVFPPRLLQLLPQPTPERDDLEGSDPVEIARHWPGALPTPPRAPVQA